MKTKLLAIVLVLIMVVTGLVACGSKEPQATTGSNQSTTGDAPDKENELTVDEYVKKLAENTFGGADFIIIGNSGTICPEKEEISVNILSDALYTRTKDIEDMFKVDIQFTSPNSEGYESMGDAVAATVADNVLSGLKSYDLVEGNLMVAGRVLLSKGVLEDVANNDYIDLSKSWWLDGLMDQFGINNRLFFLTGKIAESHYRTACATLFNKKVAREFNIDTAALYAAVADGTWTIDKQIEVGSVISGGNGTYQCITGGASGGLMYYYGGGFTTTGKDSDGYITLPTSLTEDQINYVEKLGRYLGDKTICLNEWDEDYALDYDPFEKGEVLFKPSSIGGALNYREKDFEFGILPVPKSSADQENYIAFSSAWGVRGIFIPSEVNDLVMTSVISEAFGALGEKILEPIFFEKALKGHTTSDMESRDVVETLYNSKFIELADIYQFGFPGADEQPSAIVVDKINRAAMGMDIELVSGYNSGAQYGQQQIQDIINVVKNYK